MTCSSSTRTTSVDWLASSLAFSGRTRTATAIASPAGAATADDEMEPVLAPDSSVDVLAALTMLPVLLAAVLVTLATLLVLRVKRSKRTGGWPPSSAMVAALEHARKTWKKLAGAVSLSCVHAAACQVGWLVFCCPTHTFRGGARNGSAGGYVSTTAVYHLYIRKT